MLTFKKKKILITVAHPDDETFGCGGLIKKISKVNDIRVLSFTNGVGARDNNKKNIIVRKKNSFEASKILGFKWLNQFDYPDNQMDTISLLKIIKDIEKTKKTFNPDVVITHNFSDLNIDHRIVAEATLTAFRPEPNEKTLLFMTFETPSSTDFRSRKNLKNFLPNYYFNIKKSIKYKINALKKYKFELKKKPHSRSIEGVKNLAKIRGNQSGLDCAEAFEIIRVINKK